ncbi:unnamed protein product [Pleuronectes platessa]|uniref:Maspardin n=1 Tax=Pleuronectes platessa TaxID=8262 RepID=A0A9N7U9Z7_PLEPL|nr:unnamed protein product [Pleuronectes platessa]
MLRGNTTTTMDDIKVSPDYNWFRSTVPLRRIIVDDDDSKVWSLYDAGPKSIRCPIIFLPPVSGTAEVFFQQLLALTGWGYRVISRCSQQQQILCIILGRGGAEAEAGSNCRDHVIMSTATRHRRQFLSSQTLLTSWKRRGEGDNKGDTPVRKKKGENSNEGIMEWKHVK